MYIKLIIFVICILINSYCRTITLTDENSVSLLSNVDVESVDHVIENMLSLNVNNIYFYLYTDGGSVFDGLKIIETINMLQENGKKIICIGHKAISMGFIIFQYCEKRYIMETSVLMHHDIQITNLSGSMSEIKKYINFLEKIDNDIKNKILENTGLSQKEFYKITEKDWWIYGDDAIKYKIAHDIIHVKCSFIEKETINIANIDSEEKYAVYNSCPLFHSPLFIVDEDI